MTQTARYVAFAALALMVNGLVFLSPASDKVRTALFFDCAITVPLCYWLLLVRPGIRGGASLGLIAAVSVMRGAYVLNSRLGMIAGGLAEVALVVFVATRVKRIEDVLPSATLARIARAELDVYRYAFGRLQPAELAEGARAFTIHESSGAVGLIWVVALLTPFEAVGMHFLLPVKMAWILTAFSVYGAIWMIAVARSFGALPMVVDGEGVMLRRGMMASLYVPREAIESVSRVRGTGSTGNHARFAVLAEPTVFVEFKRGLQLELPMGFRREVRGAAVAPDDVSGFRGVVSGLHGGVEGR